MNIKVYLWQGVKKLLVNMGDGTHTFYIKLINTDVANALGLFRARWEERL